MASKKLTSTTGCRQAEIWIQPSLDGELDPHKAAALRVHLRACSACAAAYRQVQEIREMIRAGMPRLERRPFALNPGLLLLDARRRRAAEDSVVRVLRRVAVAAALVSIVSGAGILASVLSIPSQREGKAMKSMAVSASKSAEDSLFGDDQTLIMAILASPPPRQEPGR